MGAFYKFRIFAIRGKRKFIRDQDKVATHTESTGEAGDQGSAGKAELLALTVFLE